MNKFLIVFLFTFCMNYSFAQNSLKLSAGGGYIFSGYSQTNLEHVKNGYILNLGIDYQISKSIYLYFLSSYQQHYFSLKELSITQPDLELASYTNNINGENSDVFEISTGFKVISSDSRIKPYFTIGAGGLYIDPGRVEIISRIIGPEFKSVTKSSYNGKSSIVGSINIALGLQISITKSTYLLIESRMITCISGPNYFPVTTSLAFGI